MTAWKATRKSMRWKKMVNNVIAALKKEIKSLETMPDKLLDLNNRKIRLALLLSDQPTIEEWNY